MYNGVLNIFVVQMRKLKALVLENACVFLFQRFQLWELLLDLNSQTQLQNDIKILICAFLKLTILFTMNGQMERVNYPQTLSASSKVKAGSNSLYSFGQGGLGGQNEGSMLLDSINCYIHSFPQDVEIIPEVTEYDQEAQYIKPECISDKKVYEDNLNIKHDDSSINSYSQFLMPKDQKQMIKPNFRQELQSNSKSEQPKFLLNSSHKNGDLIIEQSLTKTDINTSLIVQKSSEKIVEHNFVYDQKLQENHLSEAKLDHLNIQSINFIRFQDNIQSKKIQSFSPSNSKFKEDCQRILGQIKQYKIQPNTELMDVQSIGKLNLYHYPGSQNNFVHNIDVPMDIEVIEINNTYPKINEENIDKTLYQEQPDCQDDKSAKSIIDLLIQNEPDFIFNTAPPNLMVVEQQHQQNQLTQKDDDKHIIINIDTSLQEQTVQNISLNVEHDNHCLEGIKEFQEASQAEANKFMNQLENSPDENIILIQNKIFAPAQQNIQILKIDQNNKRQQKGDQIMEISAVNCQLIQQKLNPIIDIDLKAVKQFSMHRVCDYMLNNQGQRQDKKQNISNTNYPNNYHDSHQNQPHNYHITNQGFKCIGNNNYSNENNYCPSINVNFKNNEMFVSILGPTLNFHNQNKYIDLQISEKKTSSHQNARQIQKHEMKHEEINKPTLLQGCQYNKDYKINEIQDKQLIIASDKKTIDCQMQYPQIQQINSFQQLLSQKLQQQRYNYIINESESYLINFLSLNQSDHIKFQSLLNQHIFLRFTPQPKTQTGKKLFKNGLLLIALVKNAVRSSQTPFISYYMYQYLISAFAPKITTNLFVFKSQYQKARSLFEIAEQRKFLEIFNKKKQVQNFDQPLIKRKTLSQNPFLSIKCEKKDEQSQVTPSKFVKLEIIKKDNRISNPNQISSASKIAQQRPLFKANPQQRASQTMINKEQSYSSIKLFPWDRQGKVKEQNCPKTKSPPDEKRQEGKEILKKTNDEWNSNSNSNSNNKKENQDVSKFSELYHKYRKLRQEKADIAFDNSSIKKNCVQQLIKSNKQQNLQEKKPTKKQVAFADNNISKDSYQNEESDLQDVQKRKRRRKNGSRSKKDNSNESNQDSGNAKKVNSKK